MTSGPAKPNLTGEYANWIVAVAQDRDRGAFISLFNALAPQVKGYLIRQGATEQNADELTQEAFLAVWREADKYDPSRAAGSAWIYTIARNLLVYHFRREHHPDDGRIDVP